MNALRRFIEKLSWLPLIVVALLMAALPLQGGSHLLQKLEMLGNGELSQPIDILDLLLHGAPSMLLLLKLIITLQRKQP